MIKLEEKVPYLPKEMMLEAVSWGLEVWFSEERTYWGQSA
jgi:hypothetical protein